VSGVLGLLQLLTLALLASLGLGAVLGHVAARMALSRVQGWPALERHRALCVLSSLPMAVGLSLFCAMLAPSLGALAFPALDHCTRHDDAHAHLCFVHLPAGAGDLGVWLALAVASAPIAYVTLRTLRVLLRSAKLVAQLLAASPPARDHALRLVPSARPLCMSVGLLRPEIAISEGLVASLDSEAVRVLLAHEGAHVARRDAARQLAAELVSVLHVPRLRRRLLSELSLAAEEVCDQVAARAVGDRLLVAATILRVARLGQAFCRRHAWRSSVRPPQSVASRHCSRPSPCLARPASGQSGPRSLLRSL
jgi:Zn-dependent protease with chaperone function